MTREELVASRDDAYSQRNRLAILLAAMCGGRIVPAVPQEPGWRFVLIFDLPTGQVSFHLPDAEMADARVISAIRWEGEPWDGHTDAEKWDRIRRCALAVPVEL